MRIKLVLSIGLVALGTLAGCGDARPRAPVSDGERLYLARCTGCHAAYEPSERTPDEWVHVVAKMERWKKVTLDDGQRALILSYLSGTEKSAAPAAATPASAALAR